MPVQEQKMEHTSISLPERQLQELGKKVSSGEYPSLSEVTRAAFREFLERHPNSQEATA